MSRIGLLRWTWLQFRIQRSNQHAAPRSLWKEITRGRSNQGVLQSSGNCGQTAQGIQKYFVGMHLHALVNTELPNDSRMDKFWFSWSHQLNVIHRDLKLANIIYNKKTQEVSLANFSLGKQLKSEDELLVDLRGAPAYISPDVYSGKPYRGRYLLLTNWLLTATLRVQITVLVTRKET